MTPSVSIISIVTSELSSTHDDEELLAYNHRLHNIIFIFILQLNILAKSLIFINAQKSTFTKYL